MVNCIVQVNHWQFQQSRDCYILPKRYNFSSCFRGSGNSENKMVPTSVENCQIGAIYFLTSGWCHVMIRIKVGCPCLCYFFSQSNSAAGTTIPLAIDLGIVFASFFILVRKKNNIKGSPQFDWASLPVQSPATVFVIIFVCPLPCPLPCQCKWEVPDSNVHQMALVISQEGYELWHPHNWPAMTTNHLPPHLANYLGHQRVFVFV